MEPLAVRYAPPVLVYVEPRRVELSAEAVESMQNVVPPQVVTPRDVVGHWLPNFPLTFGYCQREFTART